MEEVAKVTAYQREEEEEEEEVVVECTFTVYEIDLDYEFDAARFFDFTRLESPLEADQAEVWFHSAGSYPPSPFVPNLVPRYEMLMENICISPKSKGLENMNPMEGVSDIEEDEEISIVDTNYRDLEGKTYGTFNSVQIGSRTKLQSTSINLAPGHTEPKAHTKLFMKPSCPRTSTLLKPTACQLAKHNRPLQAGDSRSNMSIVKMDKSSVCISGIENHAAKRQKLEGGLLRKVVDAEQLQQINFVHKVPKRDGTTNHTKTRITIPREPDLETAHRAMKSRPKSSKEAENVTSTVRRFKALPLNRKILEAPSLLPKRSLPILPNFQEFHLKTSERAMLHKSAVSNFAIPSHQSDKASHKIYTNITTDQGNREPERPPTNMNISKPEIRESSHGFKALPLNKKILTSKGTFGVFRNTKKDITVPMEFNFHTEKRFNHNPPTELFNKLSLASETPQTARHESKLPRSISKSAKGSKENRWGCFQKGNEIKQTSKPRLPVLVGKQHIGVEAEKIEVYATSCVNWSNDVC